MRGLWIAMLGVGMMVPVGVSAQAQQVNKTQAQQVNKTQAQQANKTQTMCKADRKAQKKTLKAEEKAARNNEKTAQAQVRAEERQKKPGGQTKALAVALTPPPM